MDDLRARIAEALRDAGKLCDDDCADPAACDAAHPIQATVLHFDEVAEIEGPVDALADLIVGVVQPELADDAWGSVWLYGSWRTITRQMTTPEREHAADAVERWNRRLNTDDPDLGPLDGLRWWREPQPAPQTCGVLNPRVVATCTEPNDHPSPIHRDAFGNTWTPRDTDKPLFTEETAR